MTKMNFDKDKYYFSQCCATCKNNVKGNFCIELNVYIDDKFVCDFYKLSRSKAKRNLIQRRDKT